MSDKKEKKKCLKTIWIVTRCESNIKIVTNKALKYIWNLIIKSFEQS